MSSSSQEELLDEVKRLGERIRSADKHLPADFYEVLQALEEEGEYEQTFSITIEGEEITLRLNIRAKDKKRPSSWQVALKFHNKRVDCIDYEPGLGWHQHGWNRETLAEKEKTSLPEMTNKMSDRYQATLENWLRLALSLMKITTRRLRT
ncbi:MAG: hypothetical protein ABIM74_04830 [candidate division WOR-3 bacterium]